MTITVPAALSTPLHPVDPALAILDSQKAAREDEPETPLHPEGLVPSLALTRDATGTAEAESASPLHPLP